MTPAIPQKQLIEACFSLIEERGWASFSLQCLSEKLDISLEEIQQILPSKNDFIPLWHTYLLEEIQKEMTSEDLEELTPKDRLLELFMLRFELMTPYRSALKSLFFGIAKDPCRYATLQAHLHTSWQALLNHANIPSSSFINRLKLEAIIGVYLYTLHQWLTKPLTEDQLQALLDRQLTWGERIMAHYQ